MNPRPTHNLTFRLAAIVLLGVAVARAEQTAVIEVREAVQVQRETIHLGDVADLQGDAAMRLRDVKLPAPANWKSVTVSLESIRRAIDARQPNWSRLKLRGPQQCVVTRMASSPEPTITDANAEAPAIAAPMATAPAVTLRHRVTEHLTQLMGGPEADVKFGFQLTDERSINQDVASLRLEFEPISTVLVGRVPINIRAYRGDQPVQTFRVTVDISRRMNVLVLRRSVARGQVLTADDLQVQELFINDLRSDPLTEIRAAVGQIALTALRPGTVLGADHIKAPVLVKRGDPVQVRCIAGSIVVTILARATQDGSLGQTISLVNERSRETLNARIVGPREAVVAIGAEEQATSNAGGAS